MNIFITLIVLVSIAFTWLTLESYERALSSSSGCRNVRQDCRCERGSYVQTLKGRPLSHWEILIRKPIRSSKSPGSIRKFDPEFSFNFFDFQYNSSCNSEKIEKISFLNKISWLFCRTKSENPIVKPQI